MMTSSKSTDVMARFMAMKPAHVEAKFKTGAELMAWQQEEGRKSSQNVADMNRQARIEKILGRSGIQLLHKNCGFRNYLAETPEQVEALEMARSYLMGFGETHGGFVFSGNVGTGKNHLATAIVRNLIKQNKAAAIITVAELCQKFRSTFDKNSPIREADLMRDVCRLDLLVLDEVGVQKTANNDYEINLLSQIIDRRQLQLKPTGMLTNLNHAEMSALLGERIMDRQTNGGMWVPFTWNSYRSRKGGKA